MDLGRGWGWGHGIFPLITRRGRKVANAMSPMEGKTWGGGGRGEFGGKLSFFLGFPS